MSAALLLSLQHHPGIGGTLDVCQPIDRTVCAVILPIRKPAARKAKNLAMPVHSGSYVWGNDELSGAIACLWLPRAELAFASSSRVQGTPR